jgi:four helix bundle protein
MATVNCFEELEIWKLARQLCNLVFECTLKEKFSKDFDLKSQIRTSSGSAMDNIAEGFERGNTKEFIYFIGIAKGSCGEARSQFYRALDYKYITEEQFHEGNNQCIELSKKISSFSNYLKYGSLKGTRYK